MNEKLSMEQIDSPLNDDNQIAFLSAVLNNSSDGIVSYFPKKNERGEIVDFIFEYMNDSSLMHTPGKKEDYLGKGFLEKFPFNKENGMFDSFKAVAETGIPSHDIYFYDEGGIRGWYKNYVVKYKERIIVYYSNDTEKTELQNQLKEKTVKLENYLAEKERHLKEKELLLQETHHRVKNNMQIISSLLSLQSKTITDPKAMEAFDNSIQRIRTMALIHEKLYRDKNFYKMRLDSFIEEVVQTTRNFYYNHPVHIKYKVRVQNLDIDVSNCVNIGLIINEIVMNSIKHAFKDLNKGEICIEAKKDNGSILLIITDNGRGLPVEFDINSIQSLGLTLVQSLVEQMEGALTIESNNGTTFRIIIPGLLK
jgi:two-component sensor histidine kinase